MAVDDENRPPETVTEAEIDAVIYEFKGDPRAAIRALLHDLKMLAEDHAATVSKGYVKGQLWAVRKFG
ncbi:hypothetical protein [Bosea sp. (in: a-proteobacteria)]|jgi:hypothetical protein|uniref:hypothetical protein n=1 Tax=Bosea sp. (in: a-proteobacteria) TaxID=1871050 RepID=UPI003F71E007